MEDPVKIFALMYLIAFELLFGFTLTQVDTAKDATVTIIMSVFMVLGFLVIVLLLIMPDDE
jgi:hypothetical protein